MDENALKYSSVEHRTSQFTGIDVPNSDFITNCMHCGLCLPSCPTYALSGLEKSSPRGRIRLIKAVAEGSLEITDGFINEMNFCLDCQACETACPAGVKYGALVESARAQIQTQGRMSWFEKGMKWLLFGQVLASKKKLKFAARLLSLFQRNDIVLPQNRRRLLRWIAPKFRNLTRLVPRIDAEFFSDSDQETFRPKGKVKHRVAFLSGCIMDVAFSKIHRDTIEVLLHNDCEVIVPKLQECCGSLHAHNGDFVTARRLARHNIDTFENLHVEAIVMNSAGCGAFMKEYERYLANDPVYAERAKTLSNSVKDLTEYLISIDFKKPASVMNRRVTYHDACHLAHAQHITVEPRSILQSIPGVELIELPEASWCCGSAGIYNVVRYDDSMKLLDRKMENVKLTDADIIVANNPGCLLQMKYGLERSGVRGEILHLATLLNMAYGGESVTRSKWEIGRKNSGSQKQSR